MKIWITFYLLGICVSILITAWDTMKMLQSQGIPYNFLQVLVHILMDPHPNFLFSWCFVVERLIKGE